MRILSTHELLSTSGGIHLVVTLPLEGNVRSSCIQGAFEARLIYENTLDASFDKYMEIVSKVCTPNEISLLENAIDCDPSTVKAEWMA